MQDKDDKKTPDIDIICEYIRESLENVNIPVSDSCWENISRRLEQERKRRQHRRALSGVAAVLLLMIMVTAVDNHRQPGTSPAIFANADTKKIEQVPVCIEGEVKSVKQEVTHSETTFSQSATHPEPLENLPVKSENISDNTEDRKDIGKESLEKRELSTSVYSLNEDNEPEISSCNNKRWTISTLIGQSGERSGKGINGLMSGSDGYLGSDGNPGSTDNHKDDCINNYSGILSFGLMICNQISKRVSLETGLVYSCLTTTFKTGEGTSFNTLRLHYIGIPINLKMSLLKISSHLELYASAGIMAEKGLQANLTEADGRPANDGNHTDENVPTHSKIKGLQYSISASAGISYKIHRNLSLYAEPHISHYFDNDQPLSIRTTHRTIPTVNTGLRFEL